MCGISGFISKNYNKDSLKHIILKMTRSLSHRGPDDQGIWINNNFGIAMGHRRLSILDLSSAGHQPMTSSCQRYTLVFNGEIYNHLNLRSELNFHSWRGHSDTETIVQCLSQWGIEKTLTKISGMFALAIFDNLDKTLTLAKDRIGEKPLYYGWLGDTFIFSSELKAMRIHNGWNNNSIDKNSLSLYFQYGYIPSPFSIWKGISKLPPASYITISIVNYLNKNIKPKKYWISKNFLLNNNPSNASFESSVLKIESLLNDSIRKQTIADVNTGVFLSGGIDSSLIAALAQSHSKSPINTFTIGFKESHYNEAEDAKKISNYLGTCHHQLYVSPQEAINIIPLLPKIYDEPFSDVSQIPTFLVSRLAKSKATVCLSGDGADELFGGYNRYTYAPFVWNFLKNIPQPIRLIVSKILLGISPNLWNYANHVIPKNFKQPSFGDRVHKLANLIKITSPAALYDVLTSNTDFLKILNHENNELLLNNNNFDFHNELSEAMYIRQMMYNDLNSYLPDDVLCKVDRASMANSLEVRAPYLDDKIVEYTLGLPTNFKINNRRGKIILRDILNKHVPEKYTNRPKQGFAVPIEFWLKGPLRDWAENLFNEINIENSEYLNTKVIKKKWKDHLEGKSNNQYWLWNILMFQSWKNEWV